jgi:hypothetical protein
VKRYLTLFAFLIVASAVRSQQLNIPSTTIFDQQYLYKVNADRNAFTTLKPLLDSRIDSLDYDAVAFYKQAKPRKNWFIRKLTRESFIVIDSGEFKLSIDPLINVSAGKGYKTDAGQKIFTNSRGLLVRGDITQRFSFETSFLESQSFFPKYLSSYVKATNVVPGMARAKAFKVTGYDYAFGNGYISFSPSRKFNLQLGHGKHFVGEGYRSMLLSDNTFNYPFLKPSFQYKWLKYDVIYSSLMIMNSGQIRSSARNEPIFRKKPGTFHLLSLKPIPMIEIGFFEGTIFNAETPGKPEQFAFANPVIGVNTLRYGLSDTSNNVLAGITLSIKPIKELSVYGQFAADDPSGSLKKSGVQAGIRATLKDFQFQAEYNKSEPFTYSSTDNWQSYTHYNQTLAHPWGAGFTEINAGVSFLLFERLIIAARSSTGKITIAGNNLFLSDSLSMVSSYVNRSPLTTDITFVTGTLQYVINPASNLSVFAQATVRMQKLEGVVKENNTGFLYFGLKTDLFTSYRDF